MNNLPSITTIAGRAVSSSFKKNPIWRQKADTSDHCWRSDVDCSRTPFCSPRGSSLQSAPEPNICRSCLSIAICRCVHASRANGTLHVIYLLVHEQADSIGKLQCARVDGCLRFVQNLVLAIISDMNHHVFAPPLPSSMFLRLTVQTRRLRV